MHVKKRRPILALALCLISGCSDAGSGSSDLGQNLDLSSSGGGGDDLSSTDLSGGGSGDMSSGPGLSVLELSAGQLGGPGFANLQGPSARFNGALRLAWDRASSLYVAELGPLRNVRQVALASGAVTTLARQLSMQDLVADGLGNIYYLEQTTVYSRVHRLVIATGVTSVVAGSTNGYADGMATLAQFNAPYGLTWDGAGNLYVAEASNHTIRRVVPATGAVTTIAGTGAAGRADGNGTSASFYSPRGVALDGLGNLYVADSLNYTIRRIVLATGQVTTVAGSPGTFGSSDGTGSAARFGAIENLAWCGGNLYAADSFYYTVRRIAVAGNVVTTLAGTAGMSGGQDGTGAAARLYRPGAVTCDGSGNLYVADDIAVRKIDLANGAVTTLAATVTHRGNVDATGPAARFNAPSGLTADGAGNVYVADSMNNSIRRVATATAAVTTLAGGMSGNIDGIGAAAGFTAPQGVGWDGGGNLYVADTGNHTIRRIVIASGAVTTLAGTGGMSGSADGLGAAARFARPTGVAADSAGNVYVADTGNHTIRQIVAASGAVTTIAGTAKALGYVDEVGTAARFSGPGNLIYDGSGNLYIADTNNSRIRQLAIATGAVTTLVGYQYPPPISQGLALDGAGNLYVADSGFGIPTPQATVRRVVLRTGAVTTVLGGTVWNAVIPGPAPASLNVPWGLAWVPNRGLFISDYNENALLLAR